MAELGNVITSFNHGKVTGNLDKYKQTTYDLRKTIRGKKGSCKSAAQI
jgi:hypothetical protein